MSCCGAAAEYPEGRLVINEDLAVYEITRDALRHRKRIVPQRSWGKFEHEQQQRGRGGNDRHEARVRDERWVV
jgi:hypothetical protein